MLPPVGAGRLSSSEPDDAALRRLLQQLHQDLPGGAGTAHVSRHGRFAEVLAALGHLSLGGTQIESLLATACGLVAETLAVDAVVLLEPGPAAGRLVVRAGAGVLSSSLGEEVPCGPGTQTGFALSQLGSTATADVHATWPGDAFLARHGLAASALAVLPGASGPLGLVGAFEAGLRAFEPEEVRFLEAAATCLSTALERHRSELERQELQARLAVADRMFSLGTLTGGVAHELNNPLSYVVANLAFIAQEVEALELRLAARGPSEAALDDSARQIIEAAADARDGVEKLHGLVRDLQTLSGAPDAPLIPLDLTPVLQACVNVARSEIKHRAQVELELAATLPSVRANEARLGQVFLNLLVNAAHALPDGKTSQHRIRIRTFTTGGRVAVEVGDTGCGIPAQQLERIFEPFFSTKAPGAGVGLGLSICKSIVEGLGGEIQVESQVGHGTTFRVLLPAAAAEPMETSREHAEPAPPARRARLMVVDDEPLVGAVIERTLGDRLDVVAVADPRDALELLARGERFDLILSDLLMPGMTGMELHEEVRRLSPDLAARMVFLSGGAFTPATREFLARPGMECIEKPFDLETIRAAVARRLSSAPPP